MAWYDQPQDQQNKKKPVDQAAYAASRLNVVPPSPTPAAPTITPQATVPMFRDIKNFIKPPKLPQVEYAKTKLADQPKPDPAEKEPEEVPIPRYLPENSPPPLAAPSMGLNVPTPAINPDVIGKDATREPIINTTKYAKMALGYTGLDNAPAIAGPVEGVAESVDELATGENLSLVAASVMNPAVGYGLGAYYIPQMAKGSYEYLKDANEQDQAGNEKEAWKGRTKGAILATMALMGIKHGGKGIIENAKGAKASFDIGRERAIARQEAARERAPKLPRELSSDIVMNQESPGVYQMPDAATLKVRPKPEIPVTEQPPSVLFQGEPSVAETPGKAGPAETPGIPAKEYPTYTPEQFRVDLETKFGLPKDQADAAAQLAEARANTWAKQNNKTPAEWFATRIASVEFGGKPGTLHQKENAPTFYSQLQKVIEEKMPNKASPDQIRGLIKGRVKEEEIQWSGLDDLLAQGKSMTKQEVLDHLKQNEVQVEEVLKGDEGFDSYKVYEDLKKSFMEEASTPDFSNGDYWHDTLKEYYNKGERFKDEDGDLIEWKDLNDDQISDIFERIPKEEITQGAQDAWDNFGREQAQSKIEDLKQNFEYKNEGRSTTKFQEHQLPGGEPGSYRELLLKLPDSNAANSFSSSHFKEPNILAHVRFNDRVGPNGEKILHLEEVQSDLHQEGRRKGYKINNDRIKELESRRLDLEKIGGDLRNEGKEIPSNIKKEWADIKNELQGQSSKVPDAPFKKTWQDLALKRTVRYAAENGYDKLTWTTGEQQAERYDLSKQVRSIEWNASKDGTKTVTISPNTGNNIEFRVMENGNTESISGDVSGNEFTGKRLDEVVGKDAASNIMAEKYGSLSGNGLKVGGEGMKGFYDKILPDTMNKLGKKFGVKVGTTDIGNGVMAHSIDIPDAMKQSVLEEGQPLFQKGKGIKGSVQFLEDGKAIIKAFNNADVSTAVHELGHVFRRDLEGQDLATVEEWAGVKKGKWKREHEEKFAQGFEQYVKTGKAPTYDLALVFEKFKAWLSEIYAKLRGLKVKVSPEVSAVFDTMLGKEKLTPERIQELKGLSSEIASAEAGSRNFLDQDGQGGTKIVKGSESTFPVQDLGSKQEQIGIVEKVLRGENLTASQHEKFTKMLEYLDEQKRAYTESRSANDSDGDISFNPEEFMKDFEATPETPIVAEPTVTAEPPALIQAPPPQSQGPKTLQRGFAKTVGESGLPLSDEARAALKEDKYVPLRNIDVMREAEEILKNNPAEADRRIMWSQDSAVDTAIGMIKAAKLFESSDAARKAGNIAEASALSSQAADIILRATSRGTTHGQSIQILSRLDMIGPNGMIRVALQHKAKAAGMAKIDKAIDALKKKDDNAGVPPRPYEDLLMEAQKQVGADLKPEEVDTIVEISKDIKRISDEIESATDPIEKGKLELLKQERTKDYFGYLNEISPSTWMDKFLELRSSSFLTGPRTHIVNVTSQLGTSAIRPTETAIAAGFELLKSMASRGHDRQVFFGEPVADVVGMVSAIPQAAKEGIRAALDSMKGVVVGGKQSEVMSGNNAIKGRTGKIVRLPFHMLSGMDAAFTIWNTKGKLASLAYRTAAKEGLKGKALLKRASEIANNPPERLVELAEKQAQEDVFKSPLGEAATKLNKVRNSKDFVGYLFKYVVPFYQTPANLPKYAAKRSPFGIFSKTNRVDYKAGGASRSEAQARVALGSLITASLLLYAIGKDDDGVPLIVGGPPKDKGERDLMYRLGIQPYTIRIGDKRVSWQRMWPFTFYFGTAAAMARAIRDRKYKESEELFTQAALDLSGMLVDQPFLTGMSDLLNVITDSERYAPSWFERQLEGMPIFPVGMQHLAQAIDPKMRQPLTYTDTAKSKIPWLSKQVIPKRDLFGHVVKREGDIANRLLSPIPMRDIQKMNDVDKELLRLRYYPTAPKEKLYNLKLDPDLFDSMSFYFGRNLENGFRSTMNSEDYKDLTLEEQANEMKKGYSGLKKEISQHYFKQQLIRNAGKYSDKSMAEKKKYLQSLINDRIITPSRSEALDGLVIGLGVKGFVPKYPREEESEPW